MMNYLVEIYTIATYEETPVIANNALRAMLFLLKRRQVFPTFCKQDAADGLYYKIVALQPDNKSDSNYDLINTIIGFLKGYGSLAGIPLNKD